MVDTLLFTACGLVCDECEYFKGEKEPRCYGCTSIQGKPFWGECPIYECTEKHTVEHCGTCSVFPCDMFIGMYDPAHGPANAVLRAGFLAYRARHGDEKAVELSRVIQY